MVEMLSNIIKYAVEGAILDSNPQVQKNAAYFFVDDEDPCENEEEEILFCKNNVCVHVASSPELQVPGYFCVKSRTRMNGRVRIFVTWTPNSKLATKREDLNNIEVTGYSQSKGLIVSEEIEPLEVFRVDLSEMKVLKLFYDEEDPTSGQFVIGNLENHYKVFNFHCGGLNRVTQILEEWRYCSSETCPSYEGIRKRCFIVNPRITMKDDCHPEEGRYDSMTAEKWKTYFNAVGQIEDVANFRKAVFFGGLSPEVRKEAWKFLLFYYQFNSTVAEREQWTREKAFEYQQLNEKRLNMTEEEHEIFWRKVQCTVDKDVVRTDRSHPYFAGESNPNVQIMRNILLNYAIHNPSVGYNQGMSDLLASVLAVVQDEVDAFWCFVGLMEVSVFVTTPKDDVMDNQLLYLRELLRLMQPKFYAHALLEDDSMSMLFCHRWLLLCFKREFFDAEVLHMWEACWSRYQTDFFHIFLCVALVKQYGGEVIAQDMSAVEMLQHFTDLSMKMEGGKVLRSARQLLRKFRLLPYIPCTLRGLLSGPGIWDSAPLPEVECSCHRECQYLTKKAKILVHGNDHLFHGGHVELGEEDRNGVSEKETLSSERLKDGEEKNQLNGVEDTKINSVCATIPEKKEAAATETNVISENSTTSESVVMAKSHEYSEMSESNQKVDAGCAPGSNINHLGHVISDEHAEWDSDNSLDSDSVDGIPYPNNSAKEESETLEEKAPLTNSESSLIENTAKCKLSDILHPSTIERPYKQLSQQKEEEERQIERVNHEKENQKINGEEKLNKNELRFNGEHVEPDNEEDQVNHS